MAPAEPDPLAPDPNPADTSEDDPIPGVAGLPDEVHTGDATAGDDQPDDPND